MSLLWFDGFETYTGNAQAIRIPELSSSYITNTTAGMGRRSTRGLRLDAWTSHYVISPQNTLADNTTIFYGIAMYRDHTSTWVYSANGPFIGIYDDLGNYHIKIHAKAGERVLEVRNNAGSILGTGTWEMPYHTWFYFELKVVIHDSAGIVQTRIDGVVDIDLSPLDTKYGSNGYVGKIKQAGPYSNHRMYFDDMYLLNGQGSKNNDYLGDRRVDRLNIDGAGAHADFTPSAGSNYQNVDEAQPDDDTTYNHSDTVGHKDTYALGSLEVLGSIIDGVKNQSTARKDDAGSRKVKLISRFNGSDYLGDEETLSDSYLTFAKIYEDNPDDSAAFEEADIAGMEPGVEITA